MALPRGRSAPVSQVIPAKVERRKRVVEAQCLCQRPPCALSQAIEAKVERRKRGVEAQNFCQRLPSALSQGIVVKVERRNRGVQAVKDQAPAPELSSSP
jgi:hypothetical protein